MAQKIAPKTYVNINGETREAASLQMPTGREFRDAWTFNGAVVEIDMVKAKEIRLGQLINEAAQAGAQAEKDALKAAFKGEATKVHKDKAAKFKGDPTPAGVSAIAAATTPEALAALKAEDLF